MLRPQLVLASASPRRVELLGHLCPDFTCHAANINEQPLAHESPSQMGQRLAIAKAQAVQALYPDAVIVGSDTLICVDQAILGKPKDEADSQAMLSTLSGRWHQVLTSVAVLLPAQVLHVQVCTDVEFCPISLQDMRAYWRSQEPQDKAGSYAIQGIGGKFVKQIKGSYSAVVGLPLVETRTLLAQAGVIA